MDCKSAILDCCFNDDDSQAFSGGIDQNLVVTDLVRASSGDVKVTATAQSVLGSHDAAIKALAFNRTQGLAISGGWDCKVNCWDHRSHRPLASSISLGPGHKVQFINFFVNFGDAKGTIHKICA
jgi:hypothetical protein